MAETKELKLDARFHKADCPGARIERYEAQRPRSNGGTPEKLEITRCIDCGGQQETVKR